MFSLLLILLLVGVVVRLDAPKFFGGKLYRPDPRTGQADVPEAFAERLRPGGTPAPAATAAPPATSPMVGTPSAPTPLPEGFPARALLAQKGLTTIEAVRSTPDPVLLAIKGIAEKTVQEIRAATAEATAQASAGTAA